MIPEIIDELRANSRFLVHELQRRGVDVALVDYERETYLATYRGRTELLVDLDYSGMPYPASAAANHKYVAKLLLGRAGLSVPRGERFFPAQINEAILFAKELGYPVAVKPCTGSGGAGVEVGLTSMTEVEQAIDALFRRWSPAPHFLVEEHFEGLEHRVFITRRGEHAVLHRDPAHVVGDGERSIHELALAESYRRMNPRATCLAPIALDDVARRHLARSGRSVSDVPARGEKVYVRGSSNVATGAVAADVTDRVHPSVLELCARALAAFPSLPYAGVDFMTHDLSAPQTAESYRIIEINTNPSIGMHMSPGAGRKRDVARVLADLIFPETAPPRAFSGYAAIE